MSDNDVPAATELGAGHSWELLGSAGYGRLAVVIAGAPEIFPVNFVARHPTVYLRTGEGTKLFGATVGHPVALEVDQVDSTGAWSVVAKGTPREAIAQDEVDAVDQLGLEPWVPTVKRHLIAIDVTSVSGRRFEFGAEPEVDPAAEPTD
ncbi:pyridoxamine 5'-phosphate oxidase family protein [Gryllotalpicola protaetiae]|uniref:Pyridoxamine 5'-phosphate oxidase family protein n=1 Tax=Gryllotalpicola protaetiae TaxID=2419771 RepID=A0A387BT62_9MICO|nr:pyridoxamine 5'-phosphate oxidase family protein [Gryllotalpicola protaetiae]AYG04226.1 pyridoxamine 5'-phosphate oxidase family protein [Gryllotalpicola protaetiae]